jgi:hypothetical protein
MTIQTFVTRCIAIFLFTTLSFLSASSQTSFDDDRFSSLRLHLDKRYFLPGESLFFTAYSLSGDTTAGKSCTVVLMDENKKIVESKRLLLNAPSAGSYFILPGTDTARYYSVQYYINTNNKPVIHSKYIFSALSIPRTTQEDKSKPTVHFFPEGNNLVKGLPVVIYCRFNNLPLTAYPLEAAVINAQGDTINIFTTTAAGCGRIEMNEPAEAAVYLQYSYAGKNYKQEIPVRFSESNKAILNLYPVTDAFVYRIRTLVSDSFSIKIENEGDLYYYATMFLNQGDDFARPLSLSQLRTGINVFHLFGADGKEISARSFYLDEGSIAATAITTVDIKEREVKINFNKKVLGNFSVSVQRLNKQQVAERETNTDTRAVDDINLQTENNNRAVEVLVSEDSLCITLTDDKTGTAFSDEPVNLVIKSEGDNFILPKTSNSKGQVFISNTAFADSASIVVFPFGKDKSKLAVTGTYKPATVFTDATEKYFSSVTNMIQHYRLPENDVTTLSLNVFKSKTLEEVVVKTKVKYRSKIDSVEQAYASGIYQSKVHNVARFDLINDYPNQVLGDVSSFLSGRIPRKAYNSYGASSALDGYNIYLNESLVDATVASTINMSEVAFISVMGNNFVAMSSFGASIIIYTKKGRSSNAADYKDGIKRNALKIKGYAFGSKYFNSIFDKKMLDDVFRNTLYWDDNIILTDQNDIQLQLLAKPTGPVKIIITGFDGAGNYLLLEKNIDVTH